MTGQTDTELLSPSEASTETSYRKMATVVVNASLRSSETKNKQT